MKKPTTKLYATTILAAALSAAFLPGTDAHAQTKILINPGDQGEQSRYSVYLSWKSAIEQALRKEKLADMNILLSTDAGADLGATRSKIPDVFIAPAHVIGSAVRYGYTPVLGIDRPVQAVLVTSADGAVDSLKALKGKRLGLPLQDSLVTYLLRGELNAANTTLKSHFATLYETRYQDALLLCLQVRRCDAVAVERSVFDRWAANGEKIKILMETRTAPALSVAIKNGTRPGVEALRAALATGPGVTQAGAALVPMAASDFDYVSTLGYFTPRSLPGATLLDAQGVKQLMEAGAVFVDTRTEVEFKAGHIPGAKLVPYVEKSAKDADFKAADDQFDLAQLPNDRGTPLIFSCNGAECWKSFKASHAALKAGYTRVHWFRGGFPEWRSAGLKIDTMH
ncbi:rhodanese-like domain-containing protein [Ramlibacter tataouinensis]|uniref:Rhodanese domain-containing protein n=1 Tax=Ramlibacter tataouinensis (strain ATCC BAA-407 / DSM 14655 / LMG 21543 / TTB310) TaxID=365046 RepID=F5Y4S9_RAMTT|nr:rhodanese-like domain-containing protein [Ramlibacter tataouinensis]AEG92585.1 hypothetical protein Rta_14940 [Ramlibacter tataouinensis TTB310]